MNIMLQWFGLMFIFFIGIGVGAYAEHQYMEEEYKNNRFYNDNRRESKK